MFKRERGTTKWLRQMADELHSHDEPVPTPDLEPVRNEMSQRISRLCAVHSDEDIEKTIDKYVDGFLAEWRQDMLERHLAVLKALDRLDVKLAGYLAQFAELNTDERGKLAEIEGVAAHIWDRVGEPDTPKIDPIR